MRSPLSRDWLSSRSSVSRVETMVVLEMVDRLTRTQRSRLMSKIRSKNTQPEIAVRSLLHRMGFRFGLHRRDLPGTPDIVLPRYGTVVFVHGCFWHGHSCKTSKMPKSRVSYWREKIAANRERDEKVCRKLRRMGWRVASVWECEIRRPEALARKLSAMVRDGRRFHKETNVSNSKTLAGKGEENRYARIVGEVFRLHYKRGAERVGFDRDEFAGVAKRLQIALPKNLGDAIYSFKYRAALPKTVSDTAPAGKEWVIANVGKGKYEFKLVRPLDLSPTAGRMVVKVPDATPEIVGAYALGDEQALLAKVRYNRLVDIFLGVVAWSLQNHLRTTVKGIGQIEVDELYVGVDRSGRQFVVPVQAKGGKDKAGRQQSEQDIACCAEKFPTLICRAVSAQFLSSNKIAMFELGLQDDEVKIVAEEHYELVPAADISAEDLTQYGRSARSPR